MKSAVAFVLALSVLLASPVWAGGAYCDDGSSAESAFALSAPGDAPSEDNGQDHINHHCGHVAQHFFGQAVADAILARTNSSTHFPQIAARQPVFIVDTLTRPPRHRLS